jgi:hypothetical protein
MDTVEFMSAQLELSVNFAAGFHSASTLRTKTFAIFLRRFHVAEVLLICINQFIPLSLQFHN